MTLRFTFRLPLFTLAAMLALPVALAGAAASDTGVKHKRSCGPVTGHTARCDARVVTDAGGSPKVSSPPTIKGFIPRDLQAAYKLPSALDGGGRTIAIVDAYDNPNAAIDLGNYRKQFGLSSCNTAPCFRKINQRGGTKPPQANAGWGQEIALDIQMVSAICPNCHILLVEADSATFADLGAAVNQAVTQGATIVSNSYGANEFSQETTAAYAGYYNRPGVTMTVSSGDNGYGASFPAALPSVISVGGTSLVRNNSPRAFIESAWAGAGSGCSAYADKPIWQAPYAACTGRMIADVSAVADPATGVAVLDTYAYQGRKGWMVFGGTSVSAPIIAGVYALAGNAATADFTYSSEAVAGLFDVVGGRNATSCSTDLLCAAVFGYDGPTGLGTPNGVAAFQVPAVVVN